MRRRRSRSRNALLVASALAALLASPHTARAQACCAGTGAVTPGRLALHESALVGAQAKGGMVLGSFDGGGGYAASPPGASELDLEQDLFGAVRVLGRGQVALLVPLVETRRSAGGHAEMGGGVGDVNLSARWDATLAGSTKWVPGIAILAGLTLPTGRPPDAPSLGALATGATGIGAWQVNVGLAVEQTFGPWLVSASLLAAQRTARTVGTANAIHERLGTQWTALAALAYAFPNDAALAASAAYTVEGDATLDGADTLGTAHRLPTLTLAGVWPLSDAWRVQGALFDSPPIAPLGLNQPASAGMSITVVRGWM